MAKPEELGLLLPRGRTPIEVEDRNVLVDPSLLGVSSGKRTSDAGKDGDGGKSGKPIVAKVYVEIGNRYVVIMPDGSLRSVLKRDVTVTERPFEPFTKTELAAFLKKQFRGFKTRITRRYICVYNTTDRFCESNTTILESMYPALKAIFKRQKFDVDDPETPLIVVMFKNKAEFQRYRQMPDSLLAYYNGVNNRVFLYQWSDAAFDAPQIAMRQATSTIAHEGVHQILHNIGVQKRLSDWPIWISEGLAEYFAPTTTGHRSKWKGVGKPNDLRMRELFRYLKGIEGLGSGNLVQHILTTDQLSSAEYAVAWALTHYLVTRKKDDLFDYLREVSESGPLVQGTDGLALFKKHLGTNLAGAERNMIKHIRGLPYSDPVKNQPYFVVAAISGKKKYATVTPSMDHAKTRRDLLMKMNVADRSRAQFPPIRRFPNQAVANQAMTLFMRSK